MEKGSVSSETERQSDSYPLTQSPAGMQRWAGKVALVTGAATGVGKETVRRLLQNGVKVIGCGRRDDVLQTLQADVGNLGELTTFPCDVSKEDQVKAMFTDIKAKYGGLEICINSAGLGRDAPILTGESKDWQLTFDVNVMGVLNVTRESVAAMKSKGAKEGHIININSLSGHRVLPMPTGHVYAASKFAVTAITNGTRHELLAEQPALNCRVSQISPGLIDTPFVETQYGAERAQQMLTSFQPLQAEDIAETVIYQLALPQSCQVQDVLLRSLHQQT